MIILFGWSFKTEKNVGPAQRRTCGVCGREAFHILHQETRWFTLFFVPVIPYQHLYTLVCPFCKTPKEPNVMEVRRLKPLAKLHNAYMTGQLHEQEYRNKVQTLDPNNEFYDDSIPTRYVTCPYCERELALNFLEIENRRFVCPLCRKPSLLVD